MSVATCLRCGFRAGARSLSLLERAVQDHTCTRTVYGGKERRASRRWPVSLKGHCYGRLGNALCVITDMSQSGMGVESMLARKPGDEVTASWRFAKDDDLFHIAGIVRRVAAGRMGIEFVDISAPDRYRIAQFLSRQAP